MNKKGETEIVTILGQLFIWSFILAFIYSFLIKIDFLIYLAGICMLLSIIGFVIMIAINSKEADKLDKIKQANEEKGLKAVLYKSDIQIYVNEEKKQWTINSLEKIYTFDNIISCELLENGTSTMQTQTNNKVSLGKAAIGGTLFGPVGAIIGGTSGKSISNTSQTDYCTSMQLKITLNNFSNPCIILNLINSNVDKSSVHYKFNLELAQQALSIFQIMIDNK